MVTLFLELSLPILALIVFFAVAVYLKIQYPPPLVLGRIIPRVCPVRSQDILDYNEEEDNGEEPTGWRLRREVRRKQLKVNLGYLSAEVTNTTLFQQALRFEKTKINPRKPGLEYEPRDIVVLELVDEAAHLRWKQVRCQSILVLRAKLGLSIKKEVFITLLAQYKKLEEEIIALAGMDGMEDSWFRGMLVERLGLMDWRVIEGGESEPDPA